MNSLSLKLSLLDAQNKAKDLFAEVIKQKIVRPGITEQAVSENIFLLAEEMFQLRQNWHKGIVRSGTNTLCLFSDNPPNLTIQEDDIVFLDFGPVFGGYEADLGETIVIGHDPVKLRLKDDLWSVFEEAKAYYQAHPDMAGAELFREVMRLSTARGWNFGSTSAGHIVGAFPHKQLIGRGPIHSICAENDTSMAALAPDGSPRHWILEIHLVDQQNKFGGFVEDLLSL